MSGNTVVLRIYLRVILVNLSKSVYFNSFSSAGVILGSILKNIPSFDLNE